MTGAAGVAGAPVQQASPSGPAILPAPSREIDPIVEVAPLTTDRPGGDFMVDVLKSLNFEYVAANPGSSFRGIHESLLNCGGNKAPEFITGCHEESSIAMAHGYAKAEGKPLLVLCHGTAGLQQVCQKRTTGPTLSSNCCVSGPVKTTTQPPTPTVPHAHAPTWGSIRIGSHFASARIANLEPRNCFNPAPKPNEKRVKPSCAAARCVAPTLPVRNDRRPFTSGMTNSRVKSA